MRNRLITLVLCTTLIFCGCSSTEEIVDISESKIVQQTAETFDSSEIDTIGISMPAAQLERWSNDAELLQSMFEEEGYNVLVSYGDNLIDTQINDINQMIDDGADLLIIAPVDSDSLGPCIKRANENNIPVVAYDRLINHDPTLLAYVSYDNYYIGKLQALYIVDAFDLNNTSNSEPINIEIFAGDSADNNALCFFNAAYEVLSPYVETGKINIISNQKSFYACSIPSWDTDLAKQKMEILLASYYTDNQQLDAVLCANDSIAHGVCDAIDSSYKLDNKIIITGQDGDKVNLQYIKEGKQSMSIYKNLNNEALATVYIVNSFLNGVSTGDDLSVGNDFDFKIRRDTISYVSDNVAITSYLLSPKTITIDNVDDFIIDE